jgi:hypothetical protein
MGETATLDGSLRVGILLPLPLARAKENVESLLSAVAGATAVALEAVRAEVVACKMWAFTRHTGVKELRKWLGERSLEELVKLVSDDQGTECAVDSADSKVYEALCSAMVTSFVRKELQEDLRAALDSASDAQVEALLKGWQLEPTTALRSDRIEQAVAALTSEEKWGQVEGWVRLYRGRIQGRERLGLTRLMDRERAKVQQCLLTPGEVLALHLYTGPEFVLINGICRSHCGKDWKTICTLLEGGGTRPDNRLCTTLFCISSALKKLSQTTPLPDSRKVYRGLGKMQLPTQFWVPHGDPAWRGGVERAFMSTTEDKDVALFYANGRGTVVEISVGRIQIGGNVAFLSMVPCPPVHDNSHPSYFPSDMNACFAPSPTAIQYPCCAVMDSPRSLVPMRA